MLSKVVDANKIRDMKIHAYVLPSPEDVDQILEVRKQETRRRKIIDSYHDDPLNAARNEAERIMAEAQEKLNEARVEATAMKSRQETELREILTKEFQAKFEKSLDRAKKNFLATIETLGKLRENIYKQSETDLMELVFEISRKVIGDEVKTSPRIVVDLLEKGFKRLKDARQYEIKVHPMDYQIISAEKERLQDILKTPGSVKFTQDESVERGGCKIVTESGEISSEPGKQLDIIMKELSDGT